MLSTKRRVKKASFEKIMKEGVFVNTTCFYLRRLKREDNSPTLFGFVVPVKVKKTSVGRHLIKRKMSAAVEKFLPGIKLGLSIIIFAKNDVSKLPYVEVEKEILELLNKAQTLIWKRVKDKVYSMNDR